MLNNNSIKNKIGRMSKNHNSNSLPSFSKVLEFYLRILEQFGFINVICSYE